ncbi:MAG TPA: MFS transporter [Candidatus Polarisedimenticolia bacterium]|nr:MFS transporter [Candidatus Polarisedimenticolia bacterium]
MLSLLFVATTVNYLDRAILGVLLPEIRNQLHFSEAAYGIIQFWFQIAYAVGSLIGGKILDRYGTRIGFALAALLWSAAATLHALAGSALQFGFLRTALGFGEAPTFPACNKATAEWFPAEERAISMGVVNFGANIANIFGPALFIWIALELSWRAGFAIVGAAGFLWVPLWLIFYRLPKRPGAAAEATSKLPMRAVLKHRQTWGYAWAKFLTDPVWWFYLFWLPTYLNDVRHLTIEQRALALTVIYAISGAGALIGGGVSSYMIRRGWTVGQARKSTMLACAILMPVSALGTVVGSAKLAVLLFGFGTAVHQAWMTNLFTTPSDVFPQRAVGSANGIGVCLGGLGGALFSGLIPGYVLSWVGYMPVLLIMSFFYLIAWVLVHTLMGDLAMIEMPEPTLSSARPSLP